MISTTSVKSASGSIPVTVPFPDLTRIPACVLFLMSNLYFHNSWSGAINAHTFDSQEARALGSCSPFGGHYGREPPYLVNSYYPPCYARLGATPLRVLRSIKVNPGANPGALFSRTILNLRLLLLCISRSPVTVSWTNIS